MAPHDAPSPMSRTGAAKVAIRAETQAAEARAREEGALPAKAPTPKTYDVKKAAEEHAASLGHTLGKWTGAAVGVADFWHTVCVNCGVAFFARWMPPPADGKDPFPAFGASENAGRRPCPGGMTPDTKGTGNFSAVSDT
jgi:hypothetical protein